MIKISLQISIETYLDDAQARAQQAELVTKNEQIKAAIEENKTETKKAYGQAISTMRSSYMIMSGISQAIGGSMAQTFTAMYGIMVSGVQTAAAIAEALASSGPAGWTQAALMGMSLAAALVSLAGVATGQTKLATQFGGFNMAVQGIGGMISSYSAM